MQNIVVFDYKLHWISFTLFRHFLWPLFFSFNFSFEKMRLEFRTLRTRTWQYAMDIVLVSRLISKILIFLWLLMTVILLFCCQKTLLQIALMWSHLIFFYLKETSNGIQFHQYDEKISIFLKMFHRAIKLYKQIYNFAWFRLTVIRYFFSFSLSSVCIVYCFPFYHSDIANEICYSYIFVFVSDSDSVIVQHNW